MASANAFIVSTYPALKSNADDPNASREGRLGTRVSRWAKIPAADYGTRERHRVSGREDGAKETGRPELTWKALMARLSESDEERVSFAPCQQFKQVVAVSTAIVGGPAERARVGSTARRELMD